MILLSQFNVTVTVFMHLNIGAFVALPLSVTQHEIVFIIKVAILFGSPDMTEKLLTGTLSLNTTNQPNLFGSIVAINRFQTAMFKVVKMI